MQKTWGLFIDGSYRPATSGRTFHVENPSNGAVVADVAEGDATDIEQAVIAAERAFPIWSALSGAERGDIMQRAAEIMKRRLPDVVSIEIEQIGRPRREMAAQLARLPEWFSYFGAVARTGGGIAGAGRRVVGLGVVANRDGTASGGGSPG